MAAIPRLAVVDRIVLSVSPQKSGEDEVNAPSLPGPDALRSAMLEGVGLER
jgi:hypothetical protein